MTRNAMSPSRLSKIPGFSIDKVAHAAGSDPEVLRLENLDTDLPPPKKAVEATKSGLEQSANNSYLPFTGQQLLREEVARKISSQTKTNWTPEQIVITCGGTEGMLDALLAVTEPGDEVILTDPTYAGMIYRVQLAGAVPRLIPFIKEENVWRLDIEALKRAINRHTKALFLMNPSIPSGAVLSISEWEIIAKLCSEYGLWLIYNAAMERILFDKREFIHPASINGLADRTIIIGSVSKEYRMIGWRIGWVAAPMPLMEDLVKAHIYNVVTATGIAQPGAIEALRSPIKNFEACVLLWQQRRNAVNAQLKNYDMIPAAGGWSQLLDVSPLGMDAKTASDILLQKGKVAVTPMTHWGYQNSSQFIRIVFSNEPMERLASLRERFALAFEK